MDQVILVDGQDTHIGTIDKLRAHQLGYLHRAFSVFIFNDQNQVLLQQRAIEKYHSGGLWTNTCCSHPRPNESLEEAAHRRLHEEMGFDCRLKYLFNFIYKAEFSNGLIEHELDHVFYGCYNLKPQADHREVLDWKYMDTSALKADLEENPTHYTEWFKIAFQRVLRHTE